MCIHAETESRRDQSAIDAFQSLSLFTCFSQWVVDTGDCRVVVVIHLSFACFAFCVWFELVKAVESY